MWGVHPIALEGRNDQTQTPLWKTEIANNRNHILKMTHFLCLDKVADAAGLR
jgi:hypothetical protein